MKDSLGNLLRPGAVMLVLLGLPHAGKAQSAVDRANRGAVELMIDDADAMSLRVAQDLASVIDDGSTRRVVAVLGKGSLQNLVDLKTLRGMDIAIVQTDVLDYARAQRIPPAVETLTYIAKLYNEEFHLLAAADIKSVADLAGKKVNLGPRGSGTMVTGSRVFDFLGIKIEAVTDDHRLALDKLAAGEIAAMAYVGGKPLALFSGLRAPGGLHFLAIPLNSRLISAYVPTRLTPDDYPDLVASSEAVDTIAVGTVMMVANLPSDSERYRNVANFIDAFFTQFSKLQEATHHPKWREVNLAGELPDWRRFPAAETWLKRNVSTPPTLSDQQMRDIFIKFLEERARVSGQPMTTSQKQELFDQFKRWQTTQTR
jgi:TRAP transporter TAXI family solute receptor